MKTAIIFTLATLLVLTGCESPSVQDKGQTVNRVLRDISYLLKFGVRPDPSTDEQLRIKTHLQYVEHLLRKKDVGDLPDHLKRNRMVMLDLLHDYWTAGRFPVNFDYPGERKPCFIDKNGNICAVGFLVEQTRGRQVAKKVSSLFQYSYITDMNLPELSDWVMQSGLTLMECAMIQPTYPPSPIYGDNQVVNINYIPFEYGLSSSIIGGTNLALSTINAVQIRQDKSNRPVPILGLFTGAGQIVLGVANLDTDKWYYFYSPYLVTNERKKAVSLMNIGMGTSTMILSACNLLLSGKTKSDKTTTWNIYSYPTTNNQLGLGLFWSKKF